MAVASNSSDVKSGKIRLPAYLSACLFPNNFPQMQVKVEHTRF